METFLALAGLLRIITKYQIQHPRAAIIGKLRSHWPSPLEKHDEKQATLRKQQQQQGAAIAENLVVHSASVISLLRKRNYTSPDLLTPLFYDLSTGLAIWGSLFKVPVAFGHGTIYRRDE